MCRKLVVFYILFTGIICLPSFGQITIDGTDITFSDLTKQDTAATGATSGSFQHNVIHVSSDLTGIENGTSLINALAAIVDAAWGKEYVIQLDPGQYDLGSQSLYMKEYINITGMGQDATRISSSGPITINGAGNATLRALSVSNTGSPSSVLLIESGGTLIIEDVFISHQGGGSGDNFGVKITNGSGSRMHRWNIEYEFDGIPAVGGKFTGISLSGYSAGVDPANGTPVPFEGSWADLNHGILEVSDDSQNLNIVGIQVGDSTPPPQNLDEPIELNMLAGSEVLVFGKPDGGATAIDIDSGANANIISAIAIADGQTGNDVINNAGTFIAVSSIFFGTHKSSIGVRSYSQCTQYNGINVQPITNTLGPYNP